MSNLIKNDQGQPSFYMIRASAGGLFAIGELNTEYPKKVQKAVTFGRGGHAAIVDRTGKLIAHPLPGWVDEMKDVSRLSIIQKMLRGETGVAQFFSPAAKADMVAGFNVVAATGWGVMVPQPFQELIDKSNQLRLVGFAIAATGILIAILMSWWLSGVLARPLSTIADTAMHVAEGDLTVRVHHGQGLNLHETSKLTQAFNDMLDQMDTANRELKVASELAFAANRAKSDFLANMSHELRTPLNAVIGFSDMIRHQRLGPVGNVTYIQYAKDIQASGQHLLDLINDILDISVVEQGKLTLHKEFVAIEGLIDECVLSVRESMFNNGAEFISKVPDNLPDVHADRRALKQIILNLLSNSAKFTSGDGQITIEVEVLNASHIIRVSDTGVGIPADKLDGITDPFVRSESNPYKSQQGTGLGLAIVKALTELHNGVLHLESEEGKGTTVTITLPMDAA